MAYLIDVCSLIYQIFDTDKYSRAVAIKLLRPDTVTLKDYLVFRICHKMAKLG